jgi:hypothetical protein
VAYDDHRFAYHPFKWKNGRLGPPQPGGSGFTDAQRLDWLDGMWLPTELCKGEVKHRARWWTNDMHDNIRAAIDAAMDKPTEQKPGGVEPVVAFGARHCGDSMCELCSPDDLKPSLQRGD